MQNNLVDNGRGQSSVTLETIAIVEKFLGLELTAVEREMLLPGLIKDIESYQALRTISLPNHVPPALQFSPLPSRHVSPPEATTDEEDRRHITETPVTRPNNLEELAFLTVKQLGNYLRQRVVTSVELTEMYLRRLKRYDPHLLSVVTLTEELALKQAKQADQELDAGHYRGPLQGIPWGAKDLLAVKGYETTWGAAPFKDQIIDEDATVVQRLAEAGAVLVAKLASGELANGDVWFKGVTKNPWDLDRGTTGSSAGPGAAVAGGLVGFAIGSETLGSIIYPSRRCGITGLRPTFGRVSRQGTMALAWSLDKLGPMARSVEDCAFILAAIHGADGLDTTAVSHPFPWPYTDWQPLRIGYVAAAFAEAHDGSDADQTTLEKLRAMGANLIPITLPNVPDGLSALILDAEAAAAFDELTRSNQDDLLRLQDESGWPNVFRRAQFISAVSYIQANRIRTLLRQQMAAMIANIDVYVCPTLGGNDLALTNLTGHPAVVVPNGSLAGNPSDLSITFTGHLFQEHQLLAVANAYQNETDFQHLHPSMNYE